MEEGGAKEGRSVAGKDQPPTSAAAIEFLEELHRRPIYDRIARLVAAGKTNLEIQAELHLNPKDYLRKREMFGRLGVRNRTELANRYNELAALQRSARAMPNSEHFPPGFKMRPSASWARRQDSPAFLRKLNADILPLAFWPEGWSSDAIHVNMKNAQPWIPEDVRPLLADLIERTTREKELQNQPFYNSVVARVDAIIPADEESSPPLRIDVGQVDYRTIHALSQHLDQADLLPAPLTIRETYLRDMRLYGRQFPATIGANLLVISADNKILLARRSGQTHTFTGCLAGTSGGFAVIAWPTTKEFQGRTTDIDVTTGKLDLLGAALRELSEEAVLHVGRELVRFFLVTLNPELANLDIYGVLRLKTYAGRRASGEYLSNVLPRSTEIEQYVAVEFSEAGLRPLWASRWVPEDKAAIVHALVRESWLNGDENASRNVLRRLADH